jgi:hypothetical protein
LNIVGLFRGLFRKSVVCTLDEILDVHWAMMRFAGYIVVSS